MRARTGRGVQPCDSRIVSEGVHVLRGPPIIFLQLGAREETA